MLSWFETLALDHADGGDKLLIKFLMDYGNIQESEEDNLEKPVQDDATTISEAPTKDLRMKDL